MVPGNDDRLVAEEAVDGSERLLQAFSRTSAIGFAILDSALRYQAINKCLARINGVPAKAHLGLGIREMFGEISERIAEPSYRRVLDFGQTSCFELKNVVLPTRLNSRYWALNTNSPIRDRAGTVRQIGMMVVEVTGQRKLEEFLHKLAGELHGTKTQQTFWVARELQDSIQQYHAALAMSLELIAQQREKSAELLAKSIEVLDQRIVAMGTLVSDTAAASPSKSNANITTST